MSSRNIRVAVAGLGVIGEGAALRLLDDPEFRYAGAFVQSSSKKRHAALPTELTFNDLHDVLSVRPDIIIDATPDGAVGKFLTRTALSNGISVVSANKQAIAGSIAEFNAVAAANSALLAYSAAVGGGVPMLETIRNIRADYEISEITAILNGTVNFILSALATGKEFSAAVRQAQELGFAEPDPTADLSGNDARAKLSILSFEAFDTETNMENVHPQALNSNIAKDISAQRKHWRQLSSLHKRDGRISASIELTCVDGDDYFSSTVGEGNALVVRTKAGHTHTVSGLGAGREPTVNSIFDDLKLIASAKVN